VWPFPATFRATWTGRTWKDSSGDKVENIIEWRGLAEDPDKLVFFDCECVQCDWRGPIDDTHDNDGEMRCPECGEPVELK
jgi:NAD-dependent SIR2 family protein deacetylase